MIDAILDWVAKRDVADWILLWGLGVGAVGMTQISALLRYDKNDPLVRIIIWVEAKPWTLRRQACLVMPIMVVGTIGWPLQLIALPAYWLCRRLTKSTTEES